jgi:NAD(P)-dependent dehydrogenase (short-subunit alcohol dehydrogenase family)
MATEMPKTDPSQAVVMITGAGSGIGAAVARRLAGRGRRLVLQGRDSEDSRARLEAVKRDCEKAGAADCVLVHLELAEARNAKQLVETALGHYGGLDQIVANAGFARQSSILDSSWSSMEQAFRVMPQSFAELLRHAIGALKDSPCARVVAVSSFVAHRYDATAPFLETAAAKAALEAIVKSAAAELAHLGITVNCVVPGFTRKDRPGANRAAWDKALAAQPSGHIADPKQVAASIEFLLQVDAAHITGAMLHVDGGLTLL